MNGRPPRYIAGDEVEMTVKIVHEMNIDSIFLAYRHDANERVEIILADDRPSTPDQLERGEKRSEWYPKT